jgi:hypothetical protein
MTPQRIILAGGNGFIGRALTLELRRRDYQVIILTRSPRPRNDDIKEIAWDGQNPGPWTQSLDGAAAIVNLAGHNINCPHTPANLALLTASRVNSVRALAAALPTLAQPPRVWVQASAIGYYGDTDDQICTETSPADTGPLADICCHWEDAFQAISEPRPRSVLLRIGFVLGRDGGALPVLNKLTRAFLGGAVGTGRQYISWIHLADLTRMFVAALEEDLTGTYNAVGPNPVTNAAFMKTLRAAWHRPWSPPAPALAVRLGARLIRSEGTLALISSRCLPERFSERRFQFEFPQLAPALHNLCHL